LDLKIKQDAKKQREAEERAHKAEVRKFEQFKSIAALSDSDYSCDDVDSE
jgi:hypothetical protein